MQKNDFNPIAIIGLSGRFPDAKNIQEFRDNLKASKDSVKAISQDRILKTTLENKEYKIGGFMEDIDVFDADFFNYANVEAETMDPVLRILIEETYLCLESSGNAPSTYRGTNTSVISSTAALDYYHHADKFDPSLVTGNLPEFISAAISRQFDLRGSSMVVNTSCSSSLAALEIACMQLQLGLCAQSIVACGGLFLFPPEKDLSSEGFGLDSPTGKSRSYSEDADGMSFGESFGVVLLKPLEDAIKDGDYVYSVIRGLGSNHNGNAAAGPTKPDSLIQKELLVNTWKKANIDPSNIHFIEGHGSGTKLGDYLEIKSIQLAFGELGINEYQCYLSSIKTNIGHCRMTAGMAGLMKTIISVRHGELYANINFSALNELVNLEKNEIQIRNDFGLWDESFDTRIAGLTSIGLSGTNYHVLLENYNNQIATSKSEFAPYPIFISSKECSAQKSQVSHILENLKNYNSIQEYSSTTIRGKDHHKHRSVLLVGSFDDLKRKLNDLEIDVNDIKNKIDKSIVFCFPQNISIETVLYFTQKYKTFGDTISSICPIENLNSNDDLRAIVFQFAMLKLLKESGVKYDTFIPIGFGKIVLGLINNTIEKDSNAIEEHMMKIAKVDFRNNIAPKLNEILKKQVEFGDVAIIDLGINGEVTEFLVENNWDQKFKILGKDSKDFYLSIIGDLYLNYQNLDYSFIASQICTTTIPPVNHVFDRKRYWLRNSPKISSEVSSDSEEAMYEDFNEVEEYLVRLWKDIANLEPQKKSDNFFDLGGESLKATKVALEIRNDFDLDVGFEDIFDFQTIEEFSKFLTTILTRNHKLKLIWINVLKIRNIDSSSNFFELGGHSLIANKLIKRIDNTFNLEINFEDVFNFPTLQEMYQLIEKEEKTERQIIPVVEISDSYALSSNQRRLYFLNQLNNSNEAYIESIPLNFPERIDLSILKKALLHLVERHEILRTNFKLINNNIRQVISNSAEDYINDIIVEHIDEANDIIEESIELAVRSIDLAKGPLFRVNIGQFINGETSILLAIHHIITDSWSTEIIIRELLFIYHQLKNNLEIRLPKLQVQYKDYAAWEQNEIETRKDEMSTFWKSKFTDFSSTTQIPYDYPLLNKITNISKVEDLVIKKEQLDAFKKVLFAKKSSLYMGILTSLSIVVNHYSKRNDVIIGSPNAGRYLKELEDQVGFYANTLVYRTLLENADTFASALEKVKKYTFEIESYKLYPFDYLIQDLNIERTVNFNPLLDVVLAFQNTATASSDLEDDVDDGNAIQQKTNKKFDLTFIVYELSGDLHISLEYNQDRYKDRTAQRILNQLEEVISKAVNAPDKDVADYLNNDKDDVAEFWNKINPKQVNDFSNLTLIEAFKQQVDKYPNKEALVFENQRLTYSQLDDKSTKLAKYINSNIDSSSLIGIELPKSHWFIISILAIWKLNKAYVPLSNYSLSDLDLGEDLTIIDDGLINDFINNSKSFDQFNLPTPVQGLSYVMFTSGTSGKPKGVMINHKGILRLVKDTNYFQFDQNFSIISTGDSNFDATTFEFWGALLNGGKLVLAKKEDLLNISHLKNLIQKERINTMWFTAGLTNQLVDFNLDTFEGLTTVLTGGERASPYHIEKLMKAYPRLKIINGYGPTENTTFSLTHHIAKVDGDIPIGIPISNTQVYIIDNNENLVGPDEVGEIILSGDGLALGYLNNDQETKKSFTHIPNVTDQLIYKTGDLAKIDESGLVHFVGRKDHQLKINGYRIEPMEIQSILSDFSEIETCVVTGCRLSNQNKVLVAFFTSEMKVDIDLIKLDLRNRLPSFTIPKYFIKVKSIPLNKNGKVDHHVLNDHFHQYISNNINDFDIKSLNTKEIEIYNIWKNILGNNVDLDKNFFENGGTSLMTLNLINDLKKIGVNISISNLYNGILIKEIANIEEPRYEAISLNNSIEEKALGDFYMIPPIFGISTIYKELADSLKGKYNCYGLNYPGIDSEDNFCESIQQIIEIMTEEILNSPSRDAAMKKPISLFGYSFGALLAYEIAKKLEIYGFDVQLYVIDRKVTLNGDKIEERMIDAILDEWLDQFGDQVDDGTKNSILDFLKNNFSLLNEYNQNGQLNSKIIAFESQGNIESSNMQEWEDFTLNSFEHFFLEGNHWEALSNNNLEILSDKILNN